MPVNYLIGLSIPYTSNPSITIATYSSFSTILSNCLID